MMTRTDGGVGIPAVSARRTPAAIGAIPQITLGDPVGAATVGRRRWGGPPTGAPWAMLVPAPVTRGGRMTRSQRARRAVGAVAVVVALVATAVAVGATPVTAAASPGGSAHLTSTSVAPPGAASAHAFNLRATPQPKLHDCAGEIEEGAKFGWGIGSCLLVGSPWYRIDWVGSRGGG